MSGITVQKLADASKRPVEEVEAHLARQLAKGLVTRNADGTYNLTPVGRQVVKLAKAKR